MPNIKEIADKADIVVNGYAFTSENNTVKVLSLNQPTKSALITYDEISETSMDDIEMSIVMEYFQKNKKYIGI